MATDRGRDADDGDTGKEEGEYEPPEEPQGPGRPDADPVRIHEEFTERRRAGGAPATPDAYARAIDQWNKLPGAVRLPSTGPPAGEPTQSPEPEEEEGEDDRDEGRQA
jgi:hypothetical protein